MEAKFKGLHLNTSKMLSRPYPNSLGLNKTLLNIVILFSSVFQDSMPKKPMILKTLLTFLTTSQVLLLKISINKKTKNLKITFVKELNNKKYSKHSEIISSHLTLSKVLWKVEFYAQKYWTKSHYFNPFSTIKIS